MKPCQSKINQSTQKRGEYKEQNGRTLSKKTKEPPKRVNHEGNIKFLNLLSVMRSISNKERGGPLERRFNLEEPSLVKEGKIRKP